MIRETTYHATQAQAQAEGDRCKAYMGSGYGYTFTVYQSGDLWALDAKWYDSCD